MIALNKDKDYIDIAKDMVDEFKHNDNMPFTRQPNHYRYDFDAEEKLNSNDDNWIVEQINWPCDLRLLGIYEYDDMITSGDQKVPYIFRDKKMSEFSEDDKLEEKVSPDFTLIEPPEIDNRVMLIPNKMHRMIFDAGVRLEEHTPWRWDDVSEKHEEQDIRMIGYEYTVAPTRALSNYGVIMSSVEWLEHEHNSFTYHEGKPLYLLSANVFVPVAMSIEIGQKIARLVHLERRLIQ